MHFESGKSYPSSFLFSELRGTNLIGFRGKDSGVIDMSFKVKTKL